LFSRLPRLASKDSTRNSQTFLGGPATGMLKAGSKNCIARCVSSGSRATSLKTYQLTKSRKNYFSWPTCAQIQMGHLIAGPRLRHNSLVSGSFKIAHTMSCHCKTLMPGRMLCWHDSGEHLQAFMRTQRKKTIFGTVKTRRSTIISIMQK